MERMNLQQLTDPQDQSNIISINFFRSAFMESLVEISEKYRGDSRVSAIFEMDFPALYAALEETGVPEDERIRMLTVLFQTCLRQFYQDTGYFEDYDPDHGRYN